MASSTPGPNPATGTFISPIATLASGSSGAKLSYVDAYFDGGAFTVSVDTSGARPRIKIAIDPLASPTFKDIAARSLVLGVGFAGATNLDVTGTALFRSPTRFSDKATFGAYIDLETIAEPADPVAGTMRIFFDGVSLRAHFNGGITKSLYPWSAMPSNCPPVLTGKDAQVTVVSAGPVATKVKSVKFLSWSTLAASGANYIGFQVAVRDRATGAVVVFAADLGIIDTQAGVTGNIEYTLWSPAVAYTLAAGHDILVYVSSNGVNPAPTWSTFIVTPG